MWQGEIVKGEMAMKAVQKKAYALLHAHYNFFILIFLGALLVPIPKTYTRSTISHEDCEVSQDTLNSIKKLNQQEDAIRITFPIEEKPWTILIYMAADNDLFPFAQRNLAQMRQVGSNKNLNILVHLDIHQPGQPKTTKRLYIEKDRILQIGPDYCMDSGSASTLIDALEWAHNDFPSEHFALVFWNHGSGDLNPALKKSINPANLFRYNPATTLIELDRSIGFIDFIEDLRLQEEAEGYTCHKRGICFDETNVNYLDDSKLMQSLSHIYHKRGQKKLDLIIFDACLMAGTGTAWIMSKFADYMVASEEVVLGPGYNYKTTLEPIAQLNNVQPLEVARHIVECYEKTYSKITNDYTHSAFALEKFEAVSENINDLANLLIQALEKQMGVSVSIIIKQSRSRQKCTYFDEPSYIDLYNFYQNLLDSIHKMKLKNNEERDRLLTKIKQTLNRGLSLMDSLIVSNVAGKNLEGAHGLSIYFPEYKMYGPHHASYNFTEFAQNNSWREFLKTYLG